MLHLKRFSESESGVAAVEFALWMVFAVPLFLTTIDFVFYNTNRIDVNKATGEAAIFAFNSRSSVDSTIGGTLENIITSSSGVDPQNLSVTITCNGSATCTDTNRVLACLNTSQLQIEFDSAPSGGNALCADGTAPGYFLKVDVTAVFDPFFGGSFVEPPETINTTLTVKLE